MNNKVKVVDPRSAGRQAGVGSMNEKNEVQLTLECVDLFEVTDLSDGRTQVKIVIPRRFADLWLIKLEELTATEAEIKAMCPDSS